MKGNAGSTSDLPGEGRGPVGKVAVTEDRVKLATFLNWAPAFAGEVYLLGRDRRRTQHAPHPILNTQSLLPSGSRKYAP